MKGALDELSKEYDIVPISPAEGDWSEETIAYWVQYCKDNNVPAVVGFAQKDSWHHPLINMGLGNITLKPHAYLIAMNKYMQRTIEPGAFWFTDIDPDNEESNDALIAKIPENEWPFMLKNTSLSLGKGVFHCATKEKMAEILDLYRSNADIRQQIKNTNDAIISRMTDAEREEAGPVPPFIGEHCVDMNKGWVEYCYEGCVMEDGTLVHYGMTEEIYMKDHTGLAYVCPPIRYPWTDAAPLDKYLTAYMTELIKRGYLKQFFNVEFWASYEEGGPGNPEFCFCEINPRCAHTFNFGYKYATGHNLFKDVFECVLNNKKPDSTPWDFWAKGESRICVEVLVNVKGSAGKRMDEVVDTAYVAKLEAHPDCKLIRHIKKDDYVITEEDAVSAAGTTLLQIWIVCDTNEEAAAKEIGMRKNLYLIKQNDEYPEFWTELASKYTGDLGICTPPE